MTRQILLTQLKRARHIGDHAAEIMLLARIKKEAGNEADSTPVGRPGPDLRLVGLSELELRWKFGDR